MRNRLIAAGLGLVFIAGCAATAEPQRAPTGSAPVRASGYLTPEQTPEAALILPPAPVEGTDRYAVDRAVFKASRSLEDSPRWKLAQADNDYTTPYLLQAFSCAVDAELTPENAPALNRILTKMLVDANQGSRTAKAVFKRKRPYLIDEGDICIAKSDALAASYDYPSGHTTLGWAAGLILAQIAPEKSGAILIRARSYGESRVVCGVHNSSAIEGGRTTGATVVAAMNGVPEFRTDMDKARQELAAIRKNPANRPDPAMCQAQAALIAKTPYPQ